MFILLINLLCLDFKSSTDLNNDMKLEKDESLKNRLFDEIQIVNNIFKRELIEGSKRFKTSILELIDWINKDILSGKNTNLEEIFSNLAQFTDLLIELDFSKETSYLDNQIDIFTNQYENFFMKKLKSKDLESNTSKILYINDLIFYTLLELLIFKQGIYKYVLRLYLLKHLYYHYRKSDNLLINLKGLKNTFEFVFNEFSFNNYKGKIRVLFSNNYDLISTLEDVVLFTENIDKILRGLEEKCYIIKKKRFVESGIKIFELNNKFDMAINELKKQDLDIEKEELNEAGIK
ncbi:hypothetical protein A0H76_1354 [Hepatospora eriocheir]|uniref:Uncharacterized protein n=1 Tax=Hepatospora eriocheir TaxID=1081669 RepID=A0A1X0QH69_9MICR|nr:hypothetical protein A0H76_1354 [Hepatospora eriocheir]